MNGLDLDPDTGRMTIEYGGRVVTTTGGTLVCLLPTLQTFSQSVTFADPDKDVAYVYNARVQNAWPGSGDYQRRVAEMCQSQFTRLPEETTVSYDLADAPDGADIFVGFVKLVRTAAPSHTWFDAALDTRLKTGEWIPWNGSGLVEAAVGLARALHLYLEAGKLRLKTQQSVMGAAGGYYTQPNIQYPPINNTINRPEVRYQAAMGLPVWTSTSSPYRKTVVNTSTSIGNPSGNTVGTALRISDAGKCSTTDPTNYASTYTVDVKGYFGRRS